MVGYFREILNLIFIKNDQPIKNHMIFTTQHNNIVEVN